MKIYSKNLSEGGLCMNRLIFKRRIIRKALTFNSENCRHVALRNNKRAHLARVKRTVLSTRFRNTNKFRAAENVLKATKRDRV